MTFQPDYIPDDVWISIFETIHLPSVLAVLARTCYRFHALASRPLLREIRWGSIDSTERNLDAWNGNSDYSTLVSLPRKVAIGINFNFCSSNLISMADHMRLHDKMYAQVQRFTMLQELVLTGTALSPYTYTVLAVLPTLRSLSITNCTFISLASPFFEHVNVSYTSPQFTAPIFDFSTLPFTSLHLHKVSAHVESGPFTTDENSLHPMHLITAPNLRSLSIRWTSSQAQIYADNHWALPNVAHLEVTMPFLTRDLVDSLLVFVEQCHPSVRISLMVEHHDLPEQHADGTRISLRGVWKYRGPLAFATCWPHEAGNQTLTHLIMTEPVELILLLRGLEKLPSGMRALELQLRRWDVELLFAVRHLFPDIERLEVRYGQGDLPADFFVTLGADILHELTDLHTLKLIHDETCATNHASGFSSAFSGWGSTQSQIPHYHWFQTAQPQPQHPHPAQNQHQHLTHQHQQPPHHHHQQQHQVPHLHHHQAPHLHHHHIPAHHYYWLPVASPSVGGFFSSSHSGDDRNVNVGMQPEPEAALERTHLKDYLVGWNRYCKCLRRVQLDDTIWERRFEGDGWTEVEV